MAQRCSGVWGQCWTPRGDDYPGCTANHSWDFPQSPACPVGLSKSACRWRVFGRACSCSHTSQAEAEQERGRPPESKKLLTLTCDWRKIFFMQSHFPSKSNPTVLHFDFYQELSTPYHLSPYLSPYGQNPPPVFCFQLSPTSLEFCMSH